MIELVISGGQTGADLAGLRAARKCGIRTAGWAPKGYLTENGPRPALLKLYGLVQTGSADYPARTRLNAACSSLTLIIAEKLDGGSRLTRDICWKIQKPVFHISPGDFEDDQSFRDVERWILNFNHRCVNIAGNRESKSPGIQKAAEKFLVTLFNSINKQT